MASPDGLCCIEAVQERGQVQLRPPIWGQAPPGFDAARVGKVRGGCTEAPWTGQQRRRQTAVTAVPLGNVGPKQAKKLWWWQACHNKVAALEVLPHR